MDRKQALALLKLISELYIIMSEPEDTMPAEAETLDFDQIFEAAEK